ncbi:MAG: acyltransferase [Mucilaginibacter sp.]|nr:acyltransferase [Mucilaginibacter sp.]
MKKLEYITVLRAIAILMVLVVHVQLQTKDLHTIHPFIIQLLSNGARGVQLFYLLSAFTLFHSFNYRYSKEKFPKTNYFIRRFFRIAPLYYLAIIYYLWQDGFGPRYFLGDAKSISTWNIIANFTFLHGFNPYWISSVVPGGWSVAVEMVFYCLLPLLFSRIKNIGQAVNFTMMALIFRSCLLIIFRHYVLISDTTIWNEYLFLYLPNQLPVFALGIVLYYLIYDNENLHIPLRSYFFASFIIIIGLSIPQDIVIPGIFYYGLAFILLALSLRKYHPKILFNSVFNYIGTVSYTLYLTHWAAIYVLNKYKIMNFFNGYNETYSILNFFLNYAMVLGVSLFFSTILFYLVESPVQLWAKKRISKINRVNMEKQVSL